MEETTPLQLVHLENNSSATATGKDGTNVVTLSESEGTANSFSTSISQGSGSSRAEAVVVEGHAEATGVYISKAPDINTTNDDHTPSPTQDLNITEINFDDPYFSPGFTDPNSWEENSTASEQAKMLGSHLFPYKKLRKIFLHRFVFLFYQKKLLFI